MNRKEVEILCPIPPDKWGRPLYFQADIIGVEGQGFVQSLSYNAIEPRTRLYHFLLIGRYIESEDDFEILESIGKGVAIGRLSWYDAARYQVFRVNQRYAAPLGVQAIEKASKFGRMPYDYLLFLKFAADYLKHTLGNLFRGQGVPRMTPADFHFVKNAAFICTEFVVATWDLVGVQVIAPKDAPVPAAFALAVRDGRIIPIDFHDGDPAHTRRAYGIQLRKAGLPWTNNKGPRRPFHKHLRRMPPTRMGDKIMSEFILVKMPAAFFKDRPEIATTIQKTVTDATGLPCLIAPLEFQVLAGDMAREELLRIKATVDRYLAATEGTLKGFKLG